MAQMTSLRVAGLFAGIGGLELGMSRAGHLTELLVESALPAAEVLRHHFPDVQLQKDVRDLNALPPAVDLVTAGFPCQDLSSVGRKTGIAGAQSGLIDEVLRLLGEVRVPWVLLENVPFLLSLSRGRALAYVTDALSELGYNWAYRIVDSQAFGLPQRRNRWYLLASVAGDPRPILLADDAGAPAQAGGHDYKSVACGFYWTEGTRALGWAHDSVPPIKCGSSVGVPSPPAIRLPDGSYITPDIRDAERLQGFEEDWTKPAEAVARPNERWRLVGNAVSVPVATWIGCGLRTSKVYTSTGDTPVKPGAPWPRQAAWRIGDGPVHAAAVTRWPQWLPRQPLHDFLRYPGKPLSRRAATGFVGRARKSSLRFPDGMLTELEAYATVAP